MRLRDSLGQVEFGKADPELPGAEVVVLDTRFYRALALNGSVGAAEAYRDGWWRCDDLVALVRLLLRNRELLDGIEKGLARPGGWMMRALDLLRANTRRGAQRNIAAHYDLGNKLFGLFLSLEDFGSSYALTLRTWRERFLANLSEVRALGYDERFIRFWEFYLAYCKGGFRERSIGVAQLLMAKPACRSAEYLVDLGQLEA